MLWIGPSLGRVERACIRSVLRQGHPLTLWCYRPPDGVPEGVTLADAAAILPERSIIRHRGGSVALFSNRFRYELQRRSLGIWLDSDIYLFRPIVCGDHLLTYGGHKTVNSAPLRLPADSPLLAPLLALFEETNVPRWLAPRARLAAEWRRRRRGRAELGLMPWGVAGPSALTALCRELGLLHLVSPAETFHPFGWSEAGWIRDPRRRIEQRATALTVGIHLWNECIKSFKEAPAPPGTFLARLHAEGE